MVSTRARIFVVSGVVQGVGYRDFARRAARRLDVVGFARNLHDGRVEVVGAGSEEALGAFLVELKRGPWASRVDAVAESETALKEDFTEFAIRG